MTSFNDLRKPPTFEEYTAWCVEDGEPAPTHAEYEATISTPAIGEIGAWGGMTFIQSKRRRG